MAKKTISLEINPDFIEDVAAALTDRKTDLDKVLTNLLKKKLGDAAKPVVAAIKYLGDLESALREEFNKSNQ